jgi:predicted transcriptional regulator
MRNFHLPLPDEVYVDLREEAERMKRPATSIARDAIEAWLRQCRKTARHEAIADFARDFAGTSQDLDPQLEKSAVSHLLGVSEDPL